MRAGIDYGLVGDVREVNVALFTEFIESGKMPVIAPLTHDGYGLLLNTNADTMASEVAIAMSKRLRCNPFSYFRNGRGDGRFEQSKVSYQVTE